MEKKLPFNSNEEIVKICPYCKYKFSSCKHIPSIYECPACKLFNKVDEHLKDVFQNIVTQYYTGYLFEIEDYHRHCSKSHGFSFLRERKHNQNILWKNSEIGLKTFYLLMYSHIEAIFFEIQNFMQEKQEKQEKIPKDLILQFDDFLKGEGKSNNIDFQGRYFKTVEFTRLVANVIKHTSGLVRNKKSGARLIKDYGFVENSSVFEKMGPIKRIGKGLCFGNTFELGCMVHVYFRDILSSLTKTKFYKYKSFDLVKTTHELVDLQLRRDIGNLIINQSKSEGLAFISNCDLSSFSDKEIESFFENKKKIIDLLYEKNRTDVVKFEIYGYCRYENKQLKARVEKLNAILHFKEIRKSDKTKLIKDSPVLLSDFLRKLTKKYDEKFIMKVYFNQFYLLKTSLLIEYIKDFYDELENLDANERVILLKLLGTAPFRGWNPFMFGMNKIYYW